MRRPLRALLLVSLLVAATTALAGCFGASDATLRVTPYVAVSLGAPGRATDFAFHVENTGSFREDVAVSAWGVPAGWQVNFSVDHLAVRGERGGRLLTATVTPAADAAVGLYTLHVKIGEVDTAVGLRLLSQNATAAGPGLGVQVRVAGLYGNGTVFLNTLREIEVDSRVPAALVAPLNLTPLKLYLGDGLPAAFADAGYHRTPAPVAAALEGMRAGETRVLRLDADAIPLAEGSPEAVLRGQVLHLLLVVERVDASPHPAGNLQCAPLLCTA